MKTYQRFAITLIMMISANVAFAGNDGKALFDKLCLSCHVISGKPMIAPPVFAVVNHVKSAHPARPDFVNYIVQWVANPQVENALMPGAVRKFGVMPKLPYDAAQVRLIAEYLYDGETARPAWYIEHYEAEHGHKPKH